MTFSIETAAKTNLYKTFIPFYLSTPSQKSSPQTHASSFSSENLSQNPLSFIYFWGHADSTPETWQQTHIECVKGCPPGEMRMDDLEFKVLWKAADESAILVRDHATYWNGEEKLTCWATVFYVRDETGKDGVRVVSYQETKDPKLTTMKGI
ncbi:hypothetical protein HK097_011089 [Rhizophlyctis rosea]|uniref:Uncharacterized protein n=1 Tax=Rhizophlyctis rosea TaxID=64517 RepID=A0AAD5X2P0_9FUNG|nr:hypothetical protein HK097_011089 [Rhizophlyctis rosea]